MFDNCTVSCHQSIFVPRSPFLKSILAGQVCGAGVKNVSIFLAGVKPDTMQRLVDYLYTGTCRVKKIKHVMEMIELKKMLQLDINIEKRIYKRETIEALGKETPAKAPSDNSSQVPPIKYPNIKSEISSAEQSQVPYENKLRLKVENSGMSGSFFQRIVKSISGEEEEENETGEDGKGRIDFESIRQEMYDDVATDNPSNDDVNVKTAENEKEDEPESDDDDSGSSSSSSDDESDESEDEREEDRRSKVKEVAAQEDDEDDDAFPVLPGDNDDGIPSIPTAVLIQELENDEHRLNSIISGYLGNSEKSRAEDCSECGHSLSPDNFVLHYGMHLEDIKSSKKKLEEGLEAEEQTRMEMEAEAEQELTEETSYQEPTPPPTPPPASQTGQTLEQTQTSQEDSVEQKIDKLQENQKRLSRDIVNFMAQFQRGAKTLECSECGESVVQNTSVGHFKSHINDLNRQIEVLVTSKKDNKRKLDRSSSEIPKKKMKEAPIRTKSQRHSSGDTEPESTRSRIGSEEERKKMYKRIYGRKKYQYRIKNCSENVTVSEEEIDAEIAKENAKYTGIPSSGSVGDSDYNLTLSPSEMLRNYVQFGSKEYKHEFKKVITRFLISFIFNL